MPKAAATTTTMAASAPSEASSSKLAQPTAKKEGKVKLVTFSGCIICRARRKKCDERKPGCETCERLSIECLGYSSKRPLYLQDKQNLEAVRAEITAFLSRSGRVRRHGKGDQAASPKGKGKARESTEPTSPEMLRFTFSLETKDDIAGAKRESDVTSSTRRVRQRRGTVTASPTPPLTTREPSLVAAPSPSGSALDAEGEDDTPDSPPSPFLRPLPSFPHGSMPPPPMHAPHPTHQPYYDAQPSASYSTSYYQTTPSLSPNTFYAPQTTYLPDDYFPRAQHFHQHAPQPQQYPQFAYSVPSTPGVMQRPLSLSPAEHIHPSSLHPLALAQPSYAQHQQLPYYPPVESYPSQHPSSSYSHSIDWHSPHPSFHPPPANWSPDPLLDSPDLIGAPDNPVPPLDSEPNGQMGDYDLQQMSGPVSHPPLSAPPPPPSLLLQTQQGDPMQYLQRQHQQHTMGFEMVPKTLDSPLERLGLPMKEFGYIQYCVELMDSMKDTARRPGSVTQQVYKKRPGVVALLTEAPEDSQAVVARLREVQTVQNMTYVAMRQSCWRDVMCCFASRHQALRRAAAAGRGRPREWTPPHVETESQLYRDRAFESLMHSLSTNSIDAVSALFTAQRMIWSEVIRGGTSAWYQPLLIARRCIQRIVGERALRGELGEGRMGEVVLYLLKYTAWVDVLGCIVLAEETPLYDLYEAVLSSPNSGIDISLVSGFTNLGYLTLLRTSLLSSHLRHHPPTTPPPHLIPSIQLALASHPSLTPTHSTPALDLLRQIYLHGARLYFLSVLSLSLPTSHPSPASPEIVHEVEHLMECVRLLPDPQLRRSAIFPLAMGGFMCRRREREVFRGWLGEGLGGEAGWVGNSRVVLWVMEGVWRRRDEMCRGKGQGGEGRDGEGEGVDWLEVMRGMGVEVLLA